MSSCNPPIRRHQYHLPYSALGRELHLLDRARQIAPLRNFGRPCYLIISVILPRRLDALYNSRKHTKKVLFVMKLGFHGFIASTVSRLEPSKCCCFVSLSVRGKLYSKEYRLGLYDVIIKGNIMYVLLPILKLILCTYRSG